ncbi:MAG: FAD-dependent oxidoreductase [Actinocatenispora sp.]
MRPGTAVVVGGGIGGLATAVGLHRAGWQVTLLERAPAFRPGRRCSSVQRHAEPIGVSLHSSRGLPFLCSNTPNQSACRCTERWCGYLPPDRPAWTASLDATKRPSPPSRSAPRIAPAPHRVGLGDLSGARSARRMPL